MIQKLLVVEDQPAWTAVVRNALRNGRLPACELQIASTYDEALKLVHEHTFRVGLLDYMLQPGAQGAKTGLDVAAELRTRGSDAKLFLITMVDPERVEARCEELGVRLIEKGRPDIEDEIIREVRHCLV